MKKLSLLLIAMTVSTALLAQSKTVKKTVSKVDLTPAAGKAIAAFASGCFWCTEHIFEALVGVDSAVSGFAGGYQSEPTYKTAEASGHAESVLVYYDPQVITYADLSKVFFDSQDPTTPNQQGPDFGTTYRSIIFYQTKEEKAVAKEARRQCAAQYSVPIAVEMKELKAFYKAAELHQNFVESNPQNQYVIQVSAPRFELFKKTCTVKLKK